MKIKYLEIDNGEYEVKNYPGPGIYLTVHPKVLGYIYFSLVDDVQVWREMCCLAESELGKALIELVKETTIEEEKVEEVPKPFTLSQAVHDPGVPLFTKDDMIKFLTAAAGTLPKGMA